MKAKGHRLQSLQPLFIQAYSTLFVEFFCKKIRNFFTRHFLKILGKTDKKRQKSRSNLRKKHASFAHSYLRLFPFSLSLFPYHDASG